MLKKLVATSILFSATAAFAADLPVRPQPVFVPPPPPPIWTGPFIGAHLGGSWGDGGNDVTGKGLYCVDGYPNQMFCGQSSYGSSFGYVTGRDGSSGSLAGGVQAGYNFQIDQSFVVGGVVDFTWLDRSSSRSAAGPVVVLGDYTERTFYEDSFRHNWLATARLRAGVAMDNLLIYATGGLAMGGLKSRSSTLTTWTTPIETLTVASGSGSSSSTATGWAAGAGLEFRISPNWSIGAEYLYYRLRDSYNVTVTTNGALFGGASSTTYRVRADGDGHLARVSLNYLFWSPPAYVAPVIARY